MTRRSIAAITGVLLALLAAAPASADPAGPTDYRSEVVSVDPVTPMIDVRVVGGDSFLAMRVQPGTDATVVGYQGEPYLWFRADGTVFENDSSPSTYVNKDRYGGADVPTSANAEAEPDWRQVASNGSWAWHDHRAHWMNPNPPPGQRPGDQILEAVIPLEVDGTPVRVTVTSVWQPDASALPIWLGLVGGLLAGMSVWILRRREWVAALVVGGVALVSFSVGWWQYRSLPTETGPRAVWWALPRVAALCALAGLVLAWRGQRFWSGAAAVLAGTELFVWGLVKRDGLSSALIPTNAPGWLDRFAVALSLSGGLTVALAVTVVVLRPVVGRTARNDDGGRSLSGTRVPSG
jgi:hypothetical protein